MRLKGFALGVGWLIANCYLPIAVSQPSGCHLELARGSVATEGASKDPEDAGFTMPAQGILATAISPHAERLAGSAAEGRFLKIAL